jgi:hypothetical protein
VRGPKSEVCRELKTAGFLAIGPLGLMAGGPEDHFTDGRELYVLVEGDEWAHMEALIMTPVTGPAGCATRQLAGAERESCDRTVSR